MKLIKLFSSIAVSLAAGGIGSLATIPNIPSWYAALDKPWFNPPNWIFGPVWTTLYILMGVSLYLVWVTPSKRRKQAAYILFGAQLFLNTLWSIVFFGLHAPFVAIGIILMLLISLIVTMRLFWDLSKLAALLLVPYVAWVSFASCLNIAIAVLN